MSLAARRYRAPTPPIDQAIHSTAISIGTRFSISRRVALRSGTQAPWGLPSPTEWPGLDRVGQGGDAELEDVGWLGPAGASVPTLAGMQEEHEMADAGNPVTVQYFYKIRWGFQDEFVELFERNHWPLLKAQMESGRLLDVRAYEPRFHGDGRQDWTFEVTITYRDWRSMEEHTDPAIVRRLYPDAEKLTREEQHRFELIEAHWDTPLEERVLPR